MVSISKQALYFFKVLISLFIDKNIYIAIFSNLKEILIIYPKFLVNVSVDENGIQNIKWVFWEKL